MIKGKYSDHLTIDKDFQPVFNEEVDKANKNLWKSFIPHENFELFLDKVIKALEREKKEDIRSIWLFGSYGTGKTHAVFVLKHLLEDDESEIDDYITKAKLNKFLSDKLKALRKREKTLVVFKSGASHVDSSYKLLLEVQDAIYKALIRYLKAKGIKYVPTKTEVQLLRERLDDEVIKWDIIIKKHRVQLREISSLDDLKKKLSHEKLDLDFIGRFVEILEKEGIIPFKLNPESIKSWIKEIINSGYVTRILFIWDEFTGFFKPGAPLDTLQELAHLTQDTPFYLLIVTHRTPEHLSKVLTEDIQKLSGRFHYIHYYTESITIYQIISRVVYPKDEKRWSFDSEKIWLTLDGSFNLRHEIQELLNEENVAVETFKRLIPMHPYSAFLSSKIVEHLGSSQRTLFQFLKQEQEGGSFPEFLKEYPKDDYYLLTPDFLWDYFFVNNSEISEFHPELIPIISYYNSWKDKLDDEDEKRVFKAVMLLIALSQKIARRHLNPFYSNIKLAFSGVPIYRRLDDILSNLVKKHALRELQHPKDKEYLIPTYEVDPRDLEKAKKDFSDFSKFISKIEDKFKDLVPYREQRIALKVITSDDILSGKIPKISFENYQIGLALILMKKAERIEDIKKNIKKVLSNYPNTLFVLSYAELGENEWNSIVNNLAYEHLLKKSNKEKEARLYRDQIDDTIKNWINRIRNGRFYTIANIEVDDSSKEYEKENVNGVDGLVTVLEEVVSLVFPYGLDKIILKDPLWKLEKSKIGLEIGLLHFKSKMTKQWEEVYNKFVEDKEYGVLDEKGDFTDEGLIKKDHPLIKMREAIKKMFEENDAISLLEIWEMLQKPPFGLYTSPLASFVLGILMKEYSRGYFATDGKVIEEVSPQGMLKYLLEVIKSRKEWVLLKLSPEQKEFCNIVKEIFKLSEEQTNTPKAAIINLRNKIKLEYKYPLWILSYAIEKEKTFKLDYYSDYSIDLIKLLDSIIREHFEEDAKDVLGDAKSKIENFVDKIVSLNDFDKTFVLEKLKDFADPKKFKEGFKIFAKKNFYDKVPIDDVKVSYDLVDQKFRDRMQEEPWAWDEKKSKEVLERMVIEFKISRLISEILKLNITFIDNLHNTIINKVKEGDILPLWFYKHHPSTTEECASTIDSLDGLTKAVKEGIVSIKDFDLSGLLKGLEDLKDNLIKIFSDRDEIVRSWLQKNLGTLSNEEFNALTEEVNEALSKEPEIEESKLLGLVKKKLNELKVTILRNDLKKKLEETLGTSNVLEFYQESFIPIVLVKYLPEFEKFKLPKDLTIDEFLKGLTKLDNLQRDALEKYLEVINDNVDVLKVLKEQDVSSKILKAFIGKDWIESIFTNDDLSDLKHYLKQKLKGNVEQWNEKMIRDAFEDWRREKYKDRFYPRLINIVTDMSEEDAKDLVKRLIDDPGIGLKIMEIIGEEGKDEG